MLTREEFEARQLTAIGISRAEYEKTFMTVTDESGFFKTIRKEDVAKHEQVRKDAAELAQFEADMQAEVDARMRDKQEASR